MFKVKNSNHGLGKPYIYIYRAALALILVSGLALSQFNSVSYASDSIFDTPLANPNFGSGWSSSDEEKLENIQGNISAAIEELKKTGNGLYLFDVGTHKSGKEDYFCNDLPSQYVGKCVYSGIHAWDECNYICIK